MQSCGVRWVVGCGWCWLEHPKTFLQWLELEPLKLSKCFWLGTLQETNISPKNGILKMIFLFPRWDMLIPWRVKEMTFPIPDLSVLFSVFFSIIFVAGIYYMIYIYTLPRTVHVGRARLGYWQGMDARYVPIANSPWNLQSFIPWRGYVLFTGGL